MGSSNASNTEGVKQALSVQMVKNNTVLLNQEIDEASDTLNVSKATARFALDVTNWTTPQELKLQGRKYHSGGDNRPASIYDTHFAGSYSSESVTKPLLTIIAIGAPATFTTANPLLANPSTADKGKIVTVNGTGDALEYGANFRELACEQTILRSSKIIPGTGTWYDLASHNSSFTDFNTEVTINVAKNSKVSINCLLGVSADDNAINALRLGKKVGNNIIWGSSSGEATAENDAQTDPKGESTNSRVECWSSCRNLHYTADQEHFETLEMSPHYVDSDPTNGLDGYHNVTYFLRFRILYRQSGNVIIGTAESNDDEPFRMNVATILSATEIGSGAITSFTQEQALAGAGGTAAFNVHTSPHYGDFSGEYLHDDTYTMSYASSANTFSNGTGSAFVAYEFTVPQIVTKYILWPRYVNQDENQNARIWELCAADSQQEYENGNFTTLDSQSLPGALSAAGATEGWPTTANSAVPNTSKPSDSLYFGNHYNLSNIGAYKYYRLNITGNYGSGLVGIQEWALYGGGFTIPSQVGHSGKILKTNGTSLKWEAPVDALLPAPQPADKGKIITVNSTGDDLEYGANFRELACEQTIITNELIIDDGELDQDAWVDLASHTTKDNINTSMNTETTVNVSQNSKVEIKAQIGFGTIGNTSNDAVGFAIRLGKKVNNVIIWGNSNGYVSGGNTDHNQNDPRFAYDANLPGRTRAWGSIIQRNPSSDDPPKDIFPINAHYIDEDPTNGVSGYNNVTYFIRVIKLFSGDGWVIGRASGTTTNTIYEHNYVGLPTILSATEIGSGAITSFTQEQALAGAGGTAAFNVHTSPHYGDFSGEYLHDDTYTMSYASSANTFSNGTGSAFVAYEFTVPQIVTKYILWPRYVNQDENQNARIWELCAADSQQEYENGNFTTLDSQSLPGALSAAGATEGWPTTANSAVPNTSKPSDSLYFGNHYNLSNIGAYKYYRLNITGNYGSGLVGIQEWALYGGGFTIPSQVGHSGKILKTNGTSLKWETIPAALLPAPEPEDAGKIVTVNSTGNDLVYSNSVDLNGVALTANPSADYNVVLPPTKPTAVGQSLKISSIAGNTAFCHWN